MNAWRLATLLFVLQVGVACGHAAPDRSAAIDAPTYSVVARIPVPHEPHDLALSPDGETLYVGSARAFEITEFDTATSTVSTIPVGAGSLGLAVTDRHVLVASHLPPSRSPSALTVIDRASRAVSTTVPLPVGLTAVRLAAGADGAVFAAAANIRPDDGGELIAIDSGPWEITTSVRVGDFPSDLLMDAGGLLYVCDGNGYKDALAVVDPVTGKRVTSIDVGRKPDRMAIDPATNRLFVASNDNPNVSVVDLEKRIVTTTFEPPDVDLRITMAVDNAFRLLFVGSVGGEAITVYDADTLDAIGSIPVGSGVNGMVMDQETHILYAIDRSHNEVVVIARPDREEL